MSATTPTETLQTESAAIRLSFTWFGVRRTLTDDQKGEIANTFGADRNAMSASKKLFDTTNPAWRAVTRIRSQARAAWKEMTLPFPDDGIRLLRRKDMHALEQRLGALRTELQENVEKLQDEYASLRAQARHQLGRLFNEKDYPVTLLGEFAITWDYPNVEAPSYLMQLSPQLYEREKARVTAQFDEAVRLAETAFTEEFGKLVGHLAERLTADDDGKQKRLTSGTLGNLHDFFDKFRNLSVRSNPQLDDLVSRAANLVKGVDTNDLKTNQTLRQTLQQQFTAIDSQIQTVLIPKRRIVGLPQQSAAETPQAPTTAA